MPTYTVTAAEGRLTAEQKARIAAEITRIHHAVTNAPAYFAQVLFVSVTSECYFVGGAPLNQDQIFIHGQIRAGRTDEEKHRLLTDLTDSMARHAGMNRNSVWIYLVDLPARQMVEFGHVLPEPGEETSWFSTLPAADRERMERTGR